MGGAEISHWITRATAAQRLGVSSVRLRELEKAGELTPRSDFNGRARLDPGKVDELRRRMVLTERPRRHRVPPPNGAMCAKIFRMFDERLELRRIVVETEQPPQTIIALRELHADMGRDFLLSSRGLTELRELLDWTGDTEKSLLGAVSARLRHQFERGKALQGSEQRNHTTRTTVNGKNHSGRADQSGRDPPRGKGPLRGDPVGETTPEPGSGDT